MTAIENEGWLRHYHGDTEKMSELNINKFLENDNLLLCLMVTRKELLTNQSCLDEFIEAKLETLRNKLISGLPQLLDVIGDRAA